MALVVFAFSVNVNDPYDNDMPADDLNVDS
jgi:hypothetical protein